MVLAEHAEGVLEVVKPQMEASHEGGYRLVSGSSQCVLGQHLNPLHLLKPFWLMVSPFCCWPAAEGNAKGLLHHCDNTVMEPGTDLLQLQPA